jgi:AbiV family abortive infection protein
MIPRAIADLGQLDDDHFFAEVSQGMQLSLTNALRLWQDAQLLRANGRAQGFQIIKLLVEEEAAKVHILLDAARCPRQPHDRFNRQLRYFIDHLARGLYAEYYQWATMDLAEAVTYLDRERQALYLDGPEDVDWIFRNAIERRREEAIYVDYIAIRDHFHDEHEWHCPNPELLGMYLQDFMPPILRIAEVLHQCGLTSPEAVRIVAEVWRNAPAPATQTWRQIQEVNLQTLNRLEAQGLLGNVTEELQNTVIRDWRAPLYPLDLRKLDTRPADLRAAQEQWVPDYY